MMDPNPHPNRTRRPRQGIGRAGTIAALCGIGFVILVGGAVFAARSVTNTSDNAASLSTPQWATVRMEPIPITVVAEGDLAAKDQLDIINLIDHPDDERIEAIVEEGTWVEKGDWLYTLSAPGLVSDRDAQISKVREAEAELEEAKRNLEIEKDTAASAEAKAYLTLELAELAHKQWERGQHPQEVRDLNLALEKAQRELEQATRELAFSKELFDKDFISRSELEEDEIRLIEAKNGMETAKLNIEVYEKYEKTKSEKEKLSDIAQAKEELGRTKRKNLNRLELMRAKIDSEKNELKQRVTRLADLERMVGNLEVEAPRSGMVFYASTIGTGWERRWKIRPGAGIRGGFRVMVLSNTSQMVATLYVHESRINEVKVGQEVTIQVNARPEELFTAKVTGKKNSAVQSGSNNPHLRQYEVLAEMPADLGEGIQPGMNCNGVIQIREIPSALAVPIQAIHTEGDDHFVFTEAQGGKVRKQAIRMGGASDTLVQVTEGLNEGARVLLRNPQPGELVNEPFVPLPELAAEPTTVSNEIANTPSPDKPLRAKDELAADSPEARAERRKERKAKKKLLQGG